MIRVKEYEPDLERVRSNICERFVRECDNGFYHSMSVPRNVIETVENVCRNYKPENHSKVLDKWLSPQMIASLTLMEDQITGDRFVGVELTNGNKFNSPHNSVESFLLENNLTGRFNAE